MRPNEFEPMNGMVSIQEAVDDDQGEATTSRAGGNEYLSLARPRSLSAVSFISLPAQTRQGRLDWARPHLGTFLLEPRCSSRQLYSCAVPFGLKQINASSSPDRNQFDPFLFFAILFLLKTIALTGTDVLLYI